MTTTTYRATTDEQRLVADSYPSGQLPRPSLFRALTWSEVLYGLANFAVAVPFFVITVVLLSLGVGLAVIYVGLLVLLVGLVVARAAGHLQRAMGYALLGTYVGPPRRAEARRPGPVAAATAIVRDGASWRAACFHAVNMVLAPVQFAATVALLGWGLGALTYPAWRPWLPVQVATDGTLHRGTQLWPDTFIDSAPGMVAFALVGALVLLAMPHVVRFFASISRLLMRALLGPAPF